MERNHAIDFVKGFGLLLVAALHITVFYEYSHVANWVINTSMRFVVPFFFLTSGYLLFKKLQKTEEKQKVFQKYLMRISMYYLGGFVVCYAFDYFVTTPIWNIPNIFFRGYMSGNFWGDFLYYGLGHMSGFHLWFLLAMLWAGIIIFLTCRNNINNIKLVTVIALVIHFIGLFGKTQSYSQFFELPIYPRDGLFFALFYMALGGFWAMGGINLKKYIPTKYTVWAIAAFLGLQLLERSILVLPLNLPFGEYWGEYLISTIPLTMVIFHYALEHGEKFKNNMFTKVGEKSIGVYITHAMAINITYMILEQIDPMLYKNPIAQIVQLIVIYGLAYYSYLAFLSIPFSSKKKKVSSPKTM